MTIPFRALAAPLLLVVLGALAPPALAQSRAPQPPRPAAPAPDSQRLLRALEDAFVSVADRATPSVVNVSVKVKREARAESGASPEMEERFREFFGPELFERFFRRQAPRDEGRAAGLDRTVTVGIISATGRTHVGVATYEAFIQTDASINPGNSGGPLLNLDGRVVGINTAIVSSGQGIGFAIPINLARDIMTQLINRGKVVRGWLGVAIQDLSPELAASLGVKEDAGALVAAVMKDGPAAAAGLRPGDVIVEFGGAAIKDVPDLQKRVAAVEPGRAAPVTLMREQKTVTLSVKIGEQPPDDAMEAEAGDEILGLTVEPLTPETARQNRLAARSGLLVTEVAPGSAGAAAGIRPGDAILEVNRGPVGDAAALRQAVAGLKPGESVPVYLQRGGGPTST